ncbi:hypothetical protein GCM10025883_22410 [Mobilicoccus caccae]|uniref:Uncharacterized protein n=1 Tax=Mobilicoccus caccae TaxID=1859295 RepID=A0ABQ6IR65_9MICO|nr:hypothetical protein GCM10025883_22410 [Mobilicoccus caccae]
MEGRDVVTNGNGREALFRELNGKLEVPEGTVRVVCMKHERPKRLLLALPGADGWTLSAMRGYAPGTSDETSGSPHVERGGARLPLGQGRVGDVVVMPCPSCSARPRVTFERVCRVLDLARSAGAVKVPLSVFDRR